MTQQPYYDATTYTLRSSLAFLIKRSQALLFDLTEPVLAAHGLSQVQYSILALLRDNITVNPKDICRAICALSETSLVERQLPWRT